jgi:transporter family protein
MWILFSLLSAIATAGVAIISKIGLSKVDSSLGFAIQSVVIVVATWVYVGVTGKTRDLTSVEPRAWAYLLGAGLVSTIAYLFYFAAIKTGDVSRVAPIDRLSLVFSVIFAGMFLSEKINGPTIFGVSLMAIGALVVAAAGSGSK